MAMNRTKSLKRLKRRQDVAEIASLLGEKRQGKAATKPTGGRRKRWAGWENGRVKGLPKAGKTDRNLIWLGPLMGDKK